MNYVKNLLGVVIFLFPIFSFAQEQVDEQIDEKTFSISAQIRPRAEYRNGAFFPRSDETLPASFVNNRTRLTMNFKRNDLEMKIAAQHINIWGEDAAINRNGRVMLNEVYAKLNFGKGLFTQLGRLLLSYDDERILGASDWNQSGRFHDALKFGYEDKSNKIHLIFAYNQGVERQSGGNFYSGGQIYKNMQTLWYNRGGSSTPFNMSILAMNLGWETGNDFIPAKPDLDQPAIPADPSTSYMQTVGTILSYALGNIEPSVSLYYQTGKNQSKRDVSAYMMLFKVNFKLIPKLSAFVAYDYLSGQVVDNEKITSFNPVFGTNHRYYGTMDYFYSNAYITSNPGFNDIQLGINFKPSKNVEILMNYHCFSVIEDKVKPNNSSEIVNINKKYLGSEVDLQINLTLMKDVRLMAGYSFMLGTETMDIVKGGDHKLWQDWGWVSLNINPQLFVSKWK